MAKSEQGRERRGPPRIDIRLSGEITCEGRSFTTRTRNLSVGGVCIECEKELAEAAPVKLSLFLVIDDVEDATLPPLQVRGLVAWSASGEDGQPATAGIRFQGLTEMQLAGLTRFLKLVA